MAWLGVFVCVCGTRTEATFANMTGMLNLLDVLLIRFYFSFAFAFVFVLFLFLLLLFTVYFCTQVFGSLTGSSNWDASIVDENKIVSCFFFYF